MEKQLNCMTPADVEKQEHLSSDLLNLVYSHITCPPDRPPSNFIDLMDWVKKHFEDHLKAKKPPMKVVNNRIIIDGQFLVFCKENNVKVTPLYSDSIVSWKTDHDFEKFFAQGVFLIEGNGFSFIHAALFHKGNQNEDEISFFVIVSQENYEKYVSFRNSFDEWIVQRDRSNLQIRVIDGEDIPYTQDNSWEDLFLPSDIKEDIRNLVEGFLASKDFYHKNKIPWKRGFLLYGQPGNGKTSIIKTIMSSYNFKPVTIVPGANDDAVREAFSYAEEQSPSLLFFEDLDSLLEKSVDISSFLNLMDGVSAKNGILVIATANDIGKLKTNLTQRPSRFDRKFEIPLPNQEMAYIYLKRWFGNLIAATKCRAIAKVAVSNKLSYAYLKDIYVSSMFEALSNNRKVPIEKDIKNALEQIIKEKNVLNGNVINIDKYFNK